MRPIDVTSTIADKLLNTMYSSVKALSDSIRVNKFKTIFEKDYTPNWIMKIFRIIKIQKTDSVTYLLEDYRRKLGGFEYELHTHRVANPDVYLVEKVLFEKGDKIYMK